MTNVSKNKDIKRLAVEDVLSSRGRVRILKLLAEIDELNVSAVSKNINLNHSAVKEHLKFLCKAGLIREKKFGRILIYQYNSENILASSLKQLFVVWEEMQ